MIIIKLQGGLGNQLFQYAAYSKLNEKYKVYFDVGEYNLPYDNGYRKFYLNYFTQKVIPNLCIFTDSRKEILCRKLLLPKLKVFRNSVKENLKALKILDERTFSDDLSEITDNTYIESYFMDERFFSKSFKDSINFSNKIHRLFSKNQYYSQIQNSNSVAVHIRRTDYLTNPNFKDICTPEYYKKAISYFNKKYPDSNFIFFSDDINWAIDQFGISSNHIYIKNDSSDDSTMRDLYLMSHCQNIIMANSSFSWWAAYLNKNQEKIVVHPEKYQNNSDTVFYSSSWLNIKSL